MKYKNNKNIAIIITAILILFGIYYLFISKDTPEVKGKSQEIISETNFKKDSIRDSSNNFTKEFIESALEVEDSTSQMITVSNYEDYTKQIAEDENAGKSSRIKYHGKRINIAVTGVDSRLGTSSKHADANHIISILADSGKIEIISIPRDTYADCGYDDTTGLNKLTVLRALKGRSAYLKEIASIARLDKIHYYVEFGFSQAIGLIELMGNKNAVSTLRVLRSRTGLGGDDYQRVYNQAQFIKQNILKNWDLANSFSGDLIIRTGLMLVETNLTYDAVEEIKNGLKANAFGGNDDISIKVRPPIPIKYKIYELTDPNVIASLSKKIDNFNKSHHKDTIKSLNINNYVSKKLLNDIESAKKANYKGNAITRLNVYYDQKAWMQIENRQQRDSIRDLLCNTLIDYYTKRKNTGKINSINQYLELEKSASKVNYNERNDHKQENL